MEEELKLVTKYCIKYPHKPVLEFNTQQERQEWMEQQPQREQFKEFTKIWEIEKYEEDEL